MPELVRRGVVPDVLTDQTSAHDTLNGYVPLAHVAGRRPRRSCAATTRSSTSAARWSRSARARAGDAGIAAARRGHLRLRQQPPRPGGRGRRRGRLSTFPASFRSTFVRCSARARGRSAGWPCRAIRRTSTAPTRPCWRRFPDDEALARWIRPGAREGAVSGTAGAHLLAGLRRTRRDWACASTRWCAAAN